MGASERKPVTSLGGRFDVRLLGPFAVSFNDSRVDIGTWRPAVARLFRLIASSPDLRRSRDDIIELLWRDSLPDAGARNLNFALHMLRRALDMNPSPILSEHRWVVLNPAYEWCVDMHRFELLASNASRTDELSVDALREAISISSTHPLPEDRYEDWAVPNIERLEASRRAVCMALAEHALDAGTADGTADEAIGWLDELLEADPLDEEALRMLLQALRLAGRRPEALRRFARFEEQLLSELGVEPSPDTIAIAHVLQQSEQSISQPQATRVHRNAHTAIAAQSRDNLPHAVTSYVGREGETAAIAELIQRPDVRLVTLFGPGGTGKTRLALEVARRVGDTFPDGVFLVELAPLSEPELIPSAIAGAIGFTLDGAKEPLAALIGHVAQQNILIALDNAEHLLAVDTEQHSVGAIVSALLAGCGGISILVTSRVRFRLQGEHVYRVAPLDLPGPYDNISELRANAAVHLFIQRARAADRTFALTEENAGEVAAICRGVDGLPLAIELAAARLGSVPMRALMTHLELRSRGSALNMLAGGSTDSARRHQALRETIAWSYNLLSAEERRLFASISVFSGGCTLEAAAAVYGDSTSGPTDALEGVISLAEKSLLQPPDSSARQEPRYLMLETIRDYGRECLELEYDAIAIRGRHAKHVFDFVSLANSNLRGNTRSDWLADLEREHANIRAAMRWSITSGELDTALGLAPLLVDFWWAHGHVFEGQRLLEEILPLMQHADITLRYRALDALGRLLWIGGDAAGAQMRCEQALTLIREAMDADRRSSGSDMLPPSEDKHTRFLVAALNHLGLATEARGEHERAREIHEELLVLTRELGETHMVADVLSELGVIAFRQGDAESARAYYLQALTIYREIDSWFNIARSLANLAEVYLSKGDVEACELAAAESLEMSAKAGHMWLMCGGIEILAMAFQARRESALAARCVAAADVVRRTAGIPIPDVEREQFEAFISSMRTELGAEAFTEAWEQGRLLTIDAAVAEAIRAIGRQQLPVSL